MDATPIKRWLREPLVHFLLLGALLFLVSSWKSGPSARTGRIVVTRARQGELRSAFQRTWERPPSEAELQVLIEEDVRDEVSVREAVAAGLDLTDPIIRRRLRRKLELSAEESVAAVSPTEEDLRIYVKAHPEAIGLLSGGVEGRLELERAWRAARSKERIEEQFRRLRTRYEVVIEPPAGGKPSGNGRKTP
jgi:hypothetical protein